MCIYIYTPVYGRWENMRQLFLSFEGRIGTKDTRRPPHASPWWSRIIYRVAWLILGLASGCLLTPEILPSLLLHRILLLSIIPSLYSYYFESRRFFDTFIPSSFLSIVKLLGTLSREREEKKKELWFSFAFEREFFSTFPSLSRNPLVSVTFSYFPFLRPSLFSWHGAHSSLVVLRLTLDLAYWFMHLSLILLRFFIPLPAYANRTSVSSSSTHPSPPLIHQFVALNPLLQVSFTLASFPFAARLRSSRNKHTGIIILRCLAIS